MRRVAFFSRTATLAAALALAAACGDDGGDTTPPTPTVGVTLASPTLSITGGSTATMNVTVSRGGGYAGAVALTLEGAPTGVTGAFAPASVAAGATTSVLTLTAASTVTAGTANLTVRAKGTGTADATAPIALTIAAAPTPSISLALAPATVSLAQGGTGSATLNITRNNGFAGAVTVATSGAPAGLTVTPASASVTANSVALAVAATSAVAAGTYNVTVTGSGTGIANQTVTLPVTVTAAPATGSYTLAVTPTTLSLAQGATGQATVNLARTNFTGAIGLAVTGAPAGLTATLGSASTTGNTTTLDVTAAAGLATGSYPLTITGTATGLTNQTATLTVTVTAAPAAGSYALTVTPTTVTLPAGGGTGAATVNLARTNFTGAVGLAITGAPAGLTATLASASTTGNSVGVTLTSTAALAAGTYPLTITGTATGLTNQTATLNVTVAAAVGGFSIAVSPATISLNKGGTTTVTVDIARTGGFTGAVDIDVANLPAGVGATIAAASSVRFSRAPLAPRGPSFVAITGNRAVITLSASAAANVGNFSLSVVASAPGFPTQTSTSATVTVANPPTPGTGNTTWTFCGTNATPIWLAYQDGTTGTWTAVTGSNGVFRFNITQSKGGVAFVQPSGTGFQTLVYYGTAAELGVYGTSQCAGATTNTGKTLTGTVAGLGTAAAGGSITANIGTAGAFASVTAPATTFTLTNVPDGARDFLASKVTTAVDLTTFAFTSTVNKLIIRRGLNPAAGSALATFDFAGTEAFDPQARTLTLTGANAGEANSVSVSYLTNIASAQSASIPLYSDVSTSGATTRTIYTVPTAQQRPGDLHLIAASSLPINQTSGTMSVRTVGKFLSASANLTLALGAELTAPTVTTVSSAAPVRYRVQAPVQAQYNQIYTASWFQGTGGTSRAVTLYATTGFSGGAAWDLSIPDLSAAGYNATWGLQAGVATGSTYTATGYDFNPLTATGVPDNGSFFAATRTNTSGINLRAVPANVIPEALRRRMTSMR